MWESMLKKIVGTITVNKKEAQVSLPTIGEVEDLKREI